jgi:rhodanese-related sulfurtransferase
MSRTFVVIFSSLLLIFINSCGQSQKNGTAAGKIILLTPSDFNEQSEKELILDVRSPEEFEEGHLEGAINHNIKEDNFSDNIHKYDRNKPVFVYCQAGVRSNRAAEKLSELGFKKIYDLEGGILNWIENDYKIAK